MTILDSLCEDYTLKVICCETRESRKQLELLYEGRDVHFLSRVEKDNPRALLTRLQKRFKLRFEISKKFRRESETLIKETKYDILWVIHELTAYEYRAFLKGKRYLLSFYELNDHRMSFLRHLTSTVQNATRVFVPEYNRACILRTWLRLKQTPTVVPNKPLGHPRKRNIPNRYSSQLEGKKIILYQGYIVRSRNIDAVCEAVKDMPGYCIVLMGKGDDTYIQELKNKYPQILHISFIAPPEHLYVTSWAHIAIVKYDFVYLNAIFCAPNKTWEYTGFDIPVLCHNIPGLQYAIGQYRAGICTDLDNIQDIRKAIEEIENNYDDFCRNARTYYESIDIKDSLLKNVAECIMI